MGLAVDPLFIEIEREDSSQEGATYLFSFLTPSLGCFNCLGWPVRKAALMEAISASRALESIWYLVLIDFK